MNVVTQGIVDGLRTLKDNTVKLSLALLEQSPEQASKLFGMNNQHVKVYITTENISQDAADMLDEWEVEAEGKSPSKRMRNVLFRLWEQDKQGYEDPELHYRFQMEKIITHFKNKLV